MPLLSRVMAFKSRLNLTIQFKSLNASQCTVECTTKLHQIEKKTFETKVKEYVKCFTFLKHHNILYSSFSVILNGSLKRVSDITKKTIVLRS